MAAIDHSNANLASLLLPFLQSQSQNTLTRLYKRPLLSPLQQQMILDLLWLDSVTSATKVVREKESNHDAAVSNLLRLYILLGSTSSVEPTLNLTFQTSLRQGLTGGDATGSFGIPATRNYGEAQEDDDSPSISALDDYSLEKREAILYYLVAPELGEQCSPHISHLLHRAGLMASSHGSPHITSAGFDFLLKSPHAQLWDLLLQYLRLAEERELDVAEALGFLFMLSTQELGGEYSSESRDMMRTETLLLKELSDYGILWKCEASSRRFYPICLATTLTTPSPLPVGTNSSPNENFILIEANFNAYAYTDNPLHTAILNLFVALRSRFHNLVVGNITRQSISKALQNGISAEQIINYLTIHAHPQMDTNNPVVPMTVQAQIRLWDLEKRRLTSQHGYLYKTFSSAADYELVINYARSLGVVVCENPRKRCFFGSLEGHARIKQFIQGAPRINS
ncbi:transcription factor Tfb2-domain-containing protein [Mycena vulgaris]|nr:transcription factor Tfb2-domain-containing protein [Mycena vulgaris]